MHEGVFAAKLLQQVRFLGISGVGVSHSHKRFGSDDSWWMGSEAEFVSTGGK